MEDDQFMFGAIYRYRPPAGEPRHPSAPHYVFAFRGTMLAHDRAYHDLYHDWKVVTNDLRKCKHFNRAVNELRYILIKPSSTPATGVWLAGHSLGASFALDVGRHMMITRDLNLPTFLFNPPQVSMAPVINLGLSNKAKNDLYDFSYKMKYKLGMTKKLRRHSERMEVLFEKLSPWQPQLYVHEGDTVCQGFIDYFEQRERLLDRYPDITLLATMMSYRDMISYLIGEDKEQPHLLPSARLWKVKKQSHSEDAHGLKQWWMPNHALGWSIYERGYKYIWKGKVEKDLQGWHFQRVLDKINDLFKTSTSDSPGCGSWGTHSECRLWLSFGLVVSHMMIECNLNPSTFLFNPPQVSVTLANKELLATNLDTTYVRIRRLKLVLSRTEGVYAFNYFMKCVLLGKAIMKCHRKRMEVIFENLPPWEPQLYVHEKDDHLRGASSTALRCGSGWMSASTVLLNQR
uniref:Fungal lipase-like domain-containing protein n=1 Tax=Oryza meridionalis TaxID=40149 RepID=A0A0E0EPF4_9ORYZ